MQRKTVKLEKKKEKKKEKRKGKTDVQQQWQL